MIKAIRGMRDILPPETSRWQWVESVARSLKEAGLTWVEAGGVRPNPVLAKAREINS